MIQVAQSFGPVSRLDNGGVLDQPAARARATDAREAIAKSPGHRFNLGLARLSG
jgi:hypothetical protein